MCCSRREIFEPFGGLKPAVNAAKTNKAGDELLEMNGFNGDVMTGDPDYQTPHVRDLELVFVAWDVLYLRNQARILPAARCCTDHGFASLGAIAVTASQPPMALLALPGFCMKPVQVRQCLHPQMRWPLRAVHP